MNYGFIMDSFELFNDTSLMAVLTPTYRPTLSVGLQSMCNKRIWWRFGVVNWFFEFSVGIRAFVIGLGQISFFFS